MDNQTETTKTNETPLFLQLLSETPGDTFIRVLGEIASEERNGKVLLFKSRDEWQLWFVGWYRNDNLDEVANRVFLTHRIGVADVLAYGMDASQLQAAVVAREQGTEAVRTVQTALDHIQAAEKRLFDAEDRFRNSGMQESKSSSIARARAELMPVREILSRK